MLIKEEIKIYLYNEPTDMRKSIDTLCILVAESMKLNPSDGNLFLFRSRSGNKVKVLYYEANCFTLWYRRLEKGKFIFPKNFQGTLEMSHEHVRWLLASDKYSCLEAVEQKEYSYFS